jgi:DNA-binding response OmpR family regulator
MKSRESSYQWGARLAKMGAMLDAPPMTARILIIEDDPNVAEVVARYLEREGYRVQTVSDGRAGLEAALADLPDLVVLDLMLPSLGGLEICRRLRAVAPVAVIMLTARGEEADRIAGLELGADDYIAKPFSPRELTARVKAVLRRATSPLVGAREPGVLRAGRVAEGPAFEPAGAADADQDADGTASAGDAEGDTEVEPGPGLEVDTIAHEARLNGQLVALTAKEFDLLVHLMRNPRRALRREELLQEVWGFSYGDTSTVTVHIRRLREKIEPDPSDPRFVRTVWGVGYRFEP